MLPIPPRPDDCAYKGVSGCQMGDTGTYECLSAARDGAAVWRGWRNGIVVWHDEGLVSLVGVLKEGEERRW